jgi:hypothetical protein
VAQIFHRDANTLTRLGIVGAILFVGTVLGLAGWYVTTPYNTGQGIPKEQPVPFSHEHHVRGLGIDCRYCHTSVEEGPFAGIPTTKTCMTCHSQIWTNAEVLEPVREAYRSGKPIPWVRVHRLPQYVYFDHSVHVAKGVACTTCHGPVHQMQLMYQQNSLHMSWCLQCHEHPEKFVGDKNAVFQPTWKEGDPVDMAKVSKALTLRMPGHRTEHEADPEKGADYVKLYHIKDRQKMMDCYMCHR